MRAFTFTSLTFVGLVFFLNPACTRQEKSESALSADPAVVAGRKLVVEKTCTTCHSLDGQPGVGPTFMYLYGKTEKLSDGSEVVVDDGYIKESIRNPAAKVVARFAPSMPAVPLTDSEVEEILALIRSLKKK